MIEAWADGGGDNVRKCNFYGSYGFELNLVRFLFRVTDLKVHSVNEAEYEMMARLLEYFVEHKMKDVQVWSDSQLVVDQINGKKRIHSLTLLPFYTRCVVALNQLENVRVDWTPRENIVKVLGH